MVATLQSKLAPRAEIFLIIDLDLWPDPSDPMHIGLMRCFKTPSADKAAFSAAIFHPPTVSKIRSLKTVPEKNQGKVRMIYTLNTALYCTYEDRENDLTKRQHALCVWPTGDRPVIRWNLMQTKDENNYRGFFPQVVRISHDAGTKTRSERVVSED